MYFTFPSFNYIIPIGSKYNNCVGYDKIIGVQFLPIGYRILTTAFLCHDRWQIKNSKRADINLYLKITSCKILGRRLR